MTGRPLSFDANKAKLIVDAIAAGNYFEAACGAAGVQYRTFRNWMKRGKKAKKGALFQFFQNVKKAEADAEMQVVAKWQSHMPGNWQACRDFLARRIPKRWASKEKHELTGKDGGPIETKANGDVAPDIDEFRKLPIEERIRLIRGPVLTPPAHRDEPPPAV